MEKALRDFIGKTLKVYTISGVESYTGVLEEANSDFIIMKDMFGKQKMYVATKWLECFHEMPKT